MVRCKVIYQSELAELGERQYYSPAIQCLPELLYGDDSMYLLGEGEDEDDSDSKQR